jgi:WD40 repeat protein
MPLIDLVAALAMRARSVGRKAAAMLAAMVLAAALAGGAKAQEEGWLGIEVRGLSKQEAEKRGLPQGRGVRVVRVIDASPAQSVGVAPDDILLSIDGGDVANVEGFVSAIAARPPGAQVKLSLARAGKEQIVTATLGRRVAETHGPQFMLDTGGHMAKVRGLAITPDGKQVVSASQDKTVRVWDIDTGKTVRMIRGEAALGQWGTIYTMALSPDGRRLAIGGYLHGSDTRLASAVRLYDFASGKLETLLKGHDDVIWALAFSPDGKWLISGSFDKTAIVWDVTSHKQLLRLSGHTKAVKAVAFTGDGERAVTGSGDETLRLWSASDGRLIAEMTEHKAASRRQSEKRAAEGIGSKGPEAWRAGVESVHVSPGEPLIASSSEDGRVLLWDARTGTFVRELVWVGGLRGSSSIFSVRFSPDGRWLVSTSVEGGCLITEVGTGRALYDGSLQDKIRTFLDAGHVICNGATAFSPDGHLVAAGYNSVIQLVDAHLRKTVKVLEGSGQQVWGVGIASDGGSIAWADVQDRAPAEGSDGTYPHRLTRQMRLPSDGRPLGPFEEISAEPPEPGQGSYMRRNRRHGTLSVGFKRPEAGSMLIMPRYLELLNDGKVQVEIDRGEGRSDAPITFSANGQAIVVGGMPIEAYDLGGRVLGEFGGHEGQVRDLAPSADGRFLVSGSSDQTVRLWNLETRELIASVFRALDGEWVVWTPQGYYASSPNGDRIVGWQINKGPEQAAEYVTASQLRHQFYRPDIVERAIVLASASKAVEEAGLARYFQLGDLTKRLPPKLSVIEPANSSETMRGRVTLALSLVEASDDPVKDFEVFVNETKVAAAAKRKGNAVSIEAPLGQGSNRVRVIARSKGDLLGEAKLEITQNGEGALDKRETLFIIAVGVDKYPQLKTCGPQQDASCDLSFAGADAKAFADTAEKQMGGQHMKVVKRVLVNGAGGELEPTRDNVENAFDALLEAKENDTVAVFIAGHGHNDPRTGYQFLPTNVRAGESGNLASSSVVKWTTLEGAIQAAKGRRLLFVDTCRAGSAYNARLIKDASDSGIVAYSATNTQQDALELPNLGHGVFTAALLEGLNGAADLAQEREVRVFDLGAFVEREVRKATNGRQTPDFYKKPGAENFVLVRM